MQTAPGDRNGIGCVRHYVWKGRLPYRLGFAARTTRVLAPDLIEACISGDLEGKGRWTFSHVDGVTTIHYEWHVRTTRRWMNLAAPVFRPFFVLNHHVLMRHGARCLAKRLDVPLLDFRYGELPREAHAGCINWLAAGLAGVFAGAVATGAQLALWWTMELPVFGMLLRDSRLAAAVVLGPEVLPPPATFDWLVMLVASALHVLLSAIYGFAMAPCIARLPRAAGIFAGGLLGLLLFWINMYGFTALFPWFAASRDWITAAAHVVFGVAVAMAYRGLQNVLRHSEWQRTRNNAEELR